MLLLKYTRTSFMTSDMTLIVQVMSFFSWPIQKNQTSGGYTSRQTRDFFQLGPMPKNYKGRELNSFLHIGI